MRGLTTLIAAAAVLLGTLGMPTVTVADDDEFREATRTHKTVMKAARQAPQWTNDPLVSGAVVQSNRKRLPDTFDSDFVGDAARREISYDSYSPSGPGKAASWIISASATGYAMARSALSSRGGEYPGGAGGVRGPVRRCTTAVSGVSPGPSSRPTAGRP